MIGLFHITVETSIAAGVRRIEAVTGQNSLRYLAGKEATLARLCGMLKVGDDALVDRIEGLMDHAKDLEQKIAKLSQGQVKNQAEEILADALAARAERAKFAWAVKDLGAIEKDTFTALCDAVSDAVKSRNLADMAIVLGAVVDGRVLFFATAGPKAVKESAVHCGELVKAAALKADGSGGGSPTRAQAGGKNPQKLSEALDTVRDILKQKAGG
jgi:alanyl-tRNA synthetase